MIRKQEMIRKMLSAGFVFPSTFFHRKLGMLREISRIKLATLAAWLVSNPCMVVDACANGPSDGGNAVLVQAEHVITGDGEMLEPGAILIRNGKIEAIGKEVVAEGAKIVHAKWVMPGLAIVPGNSTLVGGRSAILKTAGQYVDDMIVRRDAGVKVAMQPTNGSRMGHLARLRKELDKAKQSLEKRSKGELDSQEPAKPESDEKKQDDAPKPEGNGDGASQPETNAASEALNASKGLDVMMDVVAGKTPVFLYCDSAMDVANGKQLAKDYGLDCIFVLGRTAYKAVDLLKDAKHPVVLDKSLVFWESEPRTRMESKVVLPKVFLDAKVPFVFQTGDGGFRTTIGSSYLWYQGAVAVKAGMSEEAALRALTLTPAELLGVSDLVGSIEAGKDADLVILSGEPLRTATWVEKTIVNGKVVYDRSNDDKLKRLLSPKAE